MKRWETLADRRIREARERGLFDDLTGTGAPISDLHVERPTGWFANRLLKTERSKLKRADLDHSIRASMAPLWRMSGEQNVRDRVAALNKEISDYNVVTNLEPKSLLDVEELIGTWRRLGRGAELALDIQPPRLDD